MQLHGQRSKAQGLDQNVAIVAVCKAALSMAFGMRTALLMQEAICAHQRDLVMTEA